MDQKKQIEELSNDIYEFGELRYGDMCDDECDKVAEKLYAAGWRKQEWISVDERLPDEGEYVLIFADSIQVARIEKGISKEQREKMKNGELPDPEEPCFAGNIGFRMLRRSILYRSADEFGNNLVPYCWKAHGGPMEWFGQRVSHWMPLPELPEAPKMKGGEE